MPAIRVGVRLALIASVCFVAPVAHAQEAKLEPGMKVVARSPGFVLRDGAKVVPVGSPLDVYRVEQVEGDRVRFYAHGREGDARAGEVVRVDQAESFFSAQIKANPKAAHGYLMRCLVRESLQHDLAMPGLIASKRFASNPRIRGCTWCERRYQVRKVT